MVSVRTIQRELNAVNDLLDGPNCLDVYARRELYGTKQALEWALGMNGAKRPVRVVLDDTEAHRGR